MMVPEGLCHIRYGRSHVERFIDLILYTGSPAHTPKMRQNGLAPLSLLCQKSTTPPPSQRQLKSCARHGIRDFIMSSTPLTPQLLRQNGFEEKMMFGNVVYVKGKVGIVYHFFWLPCNIKTGAPLSTSIAISTYEELQRLIKEGD